ncbi:aldolase/citrate lyase family protein [Microbacterium sp. SD291]|uniref:aldolase/citrate lyase family protein n=1 Tax=Microbacterium sp. SD291 TaxID=2782007 RepID=UPI001A963F1E|nr:aldolase/citrate lyase family protein [Microbacterium sp. SD291]MBO0980091.1 hypothetical protein [Microbacterium sp. SD291]
MNVASRRRPEVGLITADPTPTLLGLLSVLGIDSIVVDAEQTGVTAADCAGVVQRLRGSGVRVGVRVPSVDGDCLLTFANTGVDELVLPRLRSPDPLETAYRATRFPPLGERPRQVSPASGYGTSYEHAPVLSVLFETVEALDRLADFIGHPRFQGGWVGPTDLADDLRRAGRGDELSDATQRIVDAVADAGHSIGLPAPSAARAHEVHARGADRSAIYWEREIGAVLRELVGARRESASSSGYNDAPSSE